MMLYNTLHATLCNGHGPVATPPSSRAPLAEQLDAEVDANSATHNAADDGHDPVLAAEHKDVDGPGRSGAAAVAAEEGPFGGAAPLRHGQAGEPVGGPRAVAEERLLAVVPVPAVPGGGEEPAAGAVEDGEKGKGVPVRVARDGLGDGDPERVVGRGAEDLVGEGAAAVVGDEDGVRAEAFETVDAALWVKVC